MLLNISCEVLFANKIFFDLDINSPKLNFTLVLSYYFVPVNLNVLCFSIHRVIVLKEPNVFRIHNILFEGVLLKIYSVVIKSRDQKTRG